MPDPRQNLDLARELRDQSRRPADALLEVRRRTAVNRAYVAVATTAAERLGPFSNGAAFHDDAEEAISQAFGEVAREYLLELRGHRKVADYDYSSALPEHVVDDALDLAERLLAMFPVPHGLS